MSRRYRPRVTPPTVGPPFIVHEVILEHPAHCDQGLLRREGWHASRYSQVAMRKSTADWNEFYLAHRELAAVRCRRFLLLGAALIVVFSLFDLFVDRIPAEVLRGRLVNNGIVLAFILGTVAALSAPRARHGVFGILFLLVVSVLAGQAYLLGIASFSPGRLAFHDLAILVLTMLGIQWMWPWQLALTALILLSYAAVVPRDHPDFGFYVLSLTGSAALATVFAQVMLSMRHRQFVTDIQLRRANEITRTQTEQLQAKNAELTDLLYVLSHDLRAPLINLEGFSQELEQSASALSEVCLAPRPDPSHAGQAAEIQRDMTESLRFIRKGVEKMTLLVNGILALARLDSKPPVFERVDLNAIVQGILSSLHYQLAQRGIVVHVADLPTVIGDPVGLNQVLSNLIDNAIKYMKSQGPAEIDVMYEPRAGGHVVSIRDTGVGIRASDQSKIFRMFTRLADNSTPGDGIGLAYVKKIVERHGGTIWVESEPGRGSLFCFTLPPAGQELGTPAVAGESPWRPLARGLEANAA